MRLPLLATITAAVAAMLAAAPAAAWNNKGHMMVAAVAWDDLTTATRTRVGKLLKLNPNYARWIAGVPKAKRSQFAFVMASTWPDFIKSNKAYTNDGSEPPADSSAGQNIGYADKLMHRYWHYKDLPFSPDSTPTVAARAPNAGTQIALFTTALADPAATADVKSYDIAWLLHLVGDVHQPLHATSRFTAAMPQGDNGGNSVLVCLPAAVCDVTHAGKLHGFWDGALGNTNSPQVAITEARSLGAPSGAVDESDPEKWLAESEALAESAAYAPPVGVGTDASQLTDAYRINAAAVARERVALAGARLAKLLNANLH